MSGITTHVLDTSLGRPAAGVSVSLAVQAQGSWSELARTETGPEGRTGDFLALVPGPVRPGGTYRLRFEVGAYFAARGVTAFYPYVEIVFTLLDDRHHHVPLLVSPFGYSTYRGS